MSDDSTNYGYIAFHYTHQNPLKADIVSKLEDWKYSSYPDYAGFRNGNWCDKELAHQLISFRKDNFIAESHKMIDGEIIKKIFIKDNWISKSPV